MSLPGLTRKQESLIRALQTRHGRRDTDLCVCDGLRSSTELLSLRPDLLELLILREGVDFSLPENLACEPVVLPATDFDKLSVTVHSQGILTVMRRPESVADNVPVSDPFALVLDRVGDPGNFGTILRTARAAGLHEIWLTKGSADPFADKVIRSASGAQFALKIRHADTLDDLRQKLSALGIIRFFRTLPAGGESVFTAPDAFAQSAVILGCEATGTAELPDSRPLHIPMPGQAESLNVAQAATVVLFEYVRRILTLT